MSVPQVKVCVPDCWTIGDVPIHSSKEHPVDPTNKNSIVMGYSMELSKLRRSASDFVKGTVGSLLFAGGWMAFKAIPQAAEFIQTYPQVGTFMNLIAGGLVATAAVSLLAYFDTRKDIRKVQNELKLRTGNPDGLATNPKSVKEVIRAYQKGTKELNRRWKQEEKKERAYNRTLARQIKALTQ